MSTKPPTANTRLKAERLKTFLEDQEQDKNVTLTTSVHCAGDSSQGQWARKKVIRKVGKEM